MSTPRIAEPILHVDMDAFFVEVERLDDEGLRDRPVAVGGVGRRGVVAAASYEARAAGVFSAMPMSIARRNCPGLTVVSARHERYAEFSARIFKIFEEFTPLVEGLSMDEAFLDIRGLRRHFRDATDVAEGIRSRIRDELGLPASVGAATTLHLAKMASGRAKPDGVLVIKEGTEREFLQGLRVEELWGVGEVTRRKLGEMGIDKVDDFEKVPRNLLEYHLGKATAARLVRLVNGIDERVVSRDKDTKSISVERTYEEDIVGLEALRTELFRHCHRLGWRLRRAGLAGRTVSLKVRLPDFRTFTRSETMPMSSDVPLHLYQASCRLLDRSGLASRPIRLLGVGVSGLRRSDEPRQLTVYDEPGWDRLSDTVDRIHLRFGRDTVVPARLRSSGSGDPV